MFAKNQSNYVAFMAPWIERLMYNLTCAHIWHGNGQLLERTKEQGIYKQPFVIYSCIVFPDIINIYIGIWLLNFKLLGSLAILAKFVVVIKFYTTLSVT